MGRKLKILITGGNGFLGHSLIKKLISHNHELLVISKNTNNLTHILDKFKFLSGYTEDISLYEKDITDFSPDIVIHFGWNGGSNYKDTNSINQLHTNIPDNIRFLDLLNKLPKKPKFIGVGSFAEYGQVTSTVDENYEESPISYYGMAKLFCKHYSENFCKANNIKWVWLRPCFIYGPNDRDNRLIPSLIKKFNKNEKVELDECKIIIDLLYIDDFINLTYELIISEYEGIYNISSGTYQPLKDVIFQIYNYLNSTSQITFNPENNRKLVQYFVSADNSKILKITNITNLTPLIKGLEQTVKYYIN
jgi:nucleoside-diphosphate-sugar epimerase